MSKSALSHGKIIKSSFKVPGWAKNRHVQTIWPRFIQKRLPLSYDMERLTLPDDDFVFFNGFFKWRNPLPKLGFTAFFFFTI